MDQISSLSLPLTDKNQIGENLPQGVGTQQAEDEVHGVTQAPIGLASVPSSPNLSSKPANVIAKPTGAGVKPTPLAKAPVVTGPSGGLAAQVNQRLATTTSIPKGLTGINTSKPDPNRQEYWHGMIYAETSARKTSSAARMFGPENTLIILCRQPEQIRPLRGLGYRVLHCETDDALVYALMYPEKAAEVLLDWPEWGTLPDRHLVFDDVTEGISLLLDRHSVNDKGEERKDARQIYKFAGAELKDLFKTLRRKKLHLTLIALARVTTNDITNEEVIAPDMPPSMAGFVSTDLEFVFFIDKTKWKFVTDSVYRSYEGVDEKGKKKVFRREIFGKNKLPLADMAKKIFPATNEVSMDLSAVWKGVKNGTPIEPLVEVKK